MLYVLAGVIGFVLALVFVRRKDTFTDSIQLELKKGKRVLMAADNQGVIMELIDGKLVHTPVLLDFELFNNGGTDVEPVDDISRH